MTTLRQAAQQALEALESGLAFDAHSTVLQNLRKALAQPEQEPMTEVADRFAHRMALDGDFGMKEIHHTGLWIRALEMEFTDDGSPHTKSYHLGWQAGIEAAAQQIEQSDLQNVRGMDFLAPMLMGIAAHLRGMK